MSPEPPTGRLLIANLDAEAELSGQPLARRARHTAAGFGTLLRVLAQPGDRLHLTAPMDAARMPEVPGLPRPVLCVREDCHPPSPKLSQAMLAWCETPTIATCRRHSLPPTPGPPGLPVHQMLWHLEPPLPEVVASVHHRSFHLRLARQLGCALPGARILHSTSALEEHLASGGAQASKESAWVLKAPFSAAGRGRFLSSEAPLGKTTRRQVERLFTRFGTLLFEPWMQRTVDFGLAGVLTKAGPLYLGVHRQLVDHRGTFRGVEFCLGEDGFEDLGPPKMQQLRRTFEEVAQVLRSFEYRGPFGIDGWCHTDNLGESTLQPLGELNARLTFGILARLLVERLCDSLGLLEGQAVRLCLGRVTRQSPASRGTTSWPLLAPDDQGNGGAILEIGPKPPTHLPFRPTPALEKAP